MPRRQKKRNVNEKKSGEKGRTREGERNGK